MGAHTLCDPFCRVHLSSPHAKVTLSNYKGVFWLALWSFQPPHIHNCCSTHQRRLQTCQYWLNYTKLMARQGNDLTLQPLPSKSFCNYCQSLFWGFGVCSAETSCFGRKWHNAAAQPSQSLDVSVQSCSSSLERPLLHMSGVASFDSHTRVTLVLPLLKQPFEPLGLPHRQKSTPTFYGMTKLFLIDRFFC